jgi:hypothetical protein
MDYVNSHAVFEARFDICYKPELDKKWIMLTVMQFCYVGDTWYLDRFFTYIQSSFIKFIETKNSANIKHIPLDSGSSLVRLYYTT